MAGKEVSGRNDINRRTFLAQSARGTAALGLSTAFVKGASAERPPRVDPNEPSVGSLPDPDGPIRLGFIGVGGIGFRHMWRFWELREDGYNLDIRAASDCYQQRKAQAASWAEAAIGHRIDTYFDYRELLERDDIDAVVIAPPDHWHALCTIHALEAGKDVYCEKPLTLTAEEALEVRNAVYRTGRVFTCGAQRTSDPAYRRARQFVEDGSLGSIIAVHADVGMNFSTAANPDSSGVWDWHIDPNASDDPGAGDFYIDWRQWLGPAPERPYSAPRFFRFRKFWDYSGGITTDFSFHQVAPLHIALGCGAPEQAAATGGRYLHRDFMEVPDTLAGSLDYPEDFSMLLTASIANSRGSANMIRGSRATVIFEDWGRIHVEAENGHRSWFAERHGSESLIINAMEETGQTATSRDAHRRNWLDCIRTREQTNCPVEIAADTMVGMRMIVDAYRKEQTIYWDREQEAYVDSHPRPNRRSKFPEIEA